MSMTGTGSRAARTPAAGDRAPVGGTLDGRYTIEAELGRGSVGRVVAVRDTAAGNVPYACKILEAPPRRDDFVSEFEVLRRLAHPGFVTAYRLGVDRGTGGMYAILERCDGPALADAGRLDLDEVVTLAGDVLRALDHLHRLDLVHGDIAPTNVLRHQGRFKLLDLGAGGRRGEREGTTSGALPFVAPERLAGRGLEAAGDLWSVGCLLFSALHGRHPWPGYPARASATGPPARDGLEATPLDALVDRLLAHEPAARQPSAGAALAELEAAIGVELPLADPRARLERLDLVPWCDVEGHVARTVQRLRSLADARRPAVIDVDGPAGSGRSRLLRELAHGLAARGIPAHFERAQPQDTARDLLSRLLGAITGSAPRALQDTATADAPAIAQAIARAAHARDRPLLVLIDDLDRASASASDGIDTLARATRAMPDRFGGLLVVCAGRGGAASAPDPRAPRAPASPDDTVRLTPWDERGLTELLAALFPGRRSGPRVVGPILAASRGNIGLALDVLASLCASNDLTVDATAIVLRDPSAARSASPGSRREAAARALAALPGPTASEVGILAWSPNPVPARLAREDPPILVATGAIAWLAGADGPRLTLASEAHAEAARALVDEADAHAELASRWRQLGDHPEANALAAWHALEADRGDADAVAAAQEALADAPAVVAAPLVDALRRCGWPTEADAARLGAETLERVGRLDEATALYRRAVELSATDAEAARALARAGAIEARCSRHARALDALREALDRGADHLERLERARILESLARCGVFSGALDDAERWTTEGLELAEGDGPLVGRFRYVQGLLRWYRGDLDGAIAPLRTALAAARGSGDAVEEGAVVTGLGLVAHRRGELDEALGHYRAALELGERANDHARVLTSLQNLAVVFHERGEWTAALDTYREALALAEALGQSGRAIQLAGNLGNLWRYLGELDAARDVLQRGLEGARAQGNRHTEAVILNLLGDVSSDAEAWTAAERLWRDAIAVADGAGCAAEEAVASLNLGRLLVARLAFDDARRALERAREVAERTDNPTVSCQALALLASIERQSIHGDHDRAAPLIDDALARLSRVDNPDARWPILLEAALVARARDAHDVALERAAEARALLQGQLDRVPARHRAAFRARRDRRLALNQLATLSPAPATTATAFGRDPGWGRLLEINKRLATELNPERLLEYIMDSAIHLTGAERGFLLLASADEASELEVHVARNLDQENIRNTHLKISQGIARRVVETGAPVVTIDAMEDERYRDQLSVHDLRLRSILCLPMIGRGRVLGAIYLDNRFRSSAFTDADLRYMEAFADLAAIALDNARLIAAKEKSQAALEKARGEVEALNARLAEQLEARTRELEDTHRVVIRQQRQLVARNQYSTIIGEAPSIRRVFAMMDRLLDNDVPVLIEGESGTGKELVARAIHFNGARQSRPFVAINCGAIPATLLESELFGHVRGAFTNATSDKKGLFEAAHMGTLLLDEIGELPLEMQVKLLRVLQSGEVKKVGSTRELHVDVRILAATNRRLEEEVRAGRFREDLYYRLSVVPITLPPLRQRREDIPLLVQHFIEKNRDAGLGQVTGIAKSALALLERYPWPGNIRQLEMVLKNASVFAEGTILEPVDFESFPDIVGNAPTMSGKSASLEGRSLADIEREAIIVALRENRGNKKRSAEQLGIDRRTLYNKLAAYQIVVEKELRVT